MIRVRSGPPPDAVNQAAQHVVFVEGSEQGVDVACLTRLLPTPVEVRGLGPSYDVRSVARALHAHHPTYYFIIDRDHISDQDVEESWARFPDPETANLLIWPRKELESYFIDPTFFIQSGHLQPRTSENALRKFVLESAQRVLFKEAANAALVSVREEIKRKSVTVFDADFPSSQEAKEALVSRLQSSNLLPRAQQAVERRRLESDFEEKLNYFSGGGEELKWGRGAWLRQMAAKKLLNEMVSRFGRVRTNQGRTLQGTAALNQIVHDLLRPNAAWPDDFQRLRQLIQKRIKA